MRVVVIAAPNPVVSFAEARARLRLGSSEQADVELMIAGATEMFDGPAGGWLCRAIGQQQLELRCDAFDDDGEPIRLPFPPAGELVSVKYLDQQGIEQAIPLLDCELVGDRLLPAFGKAFPTPLARAEAVRIRWNAGYAEVPTRIKNAILLAVGDMHRFRETLAVTTVDELPSAASINELVGTLRVYA